MASWLALHCPELPLEIFEVRSSSPCISELGHYDPGMGPVEGFTGALKKARQLRKLMVHGGYSEKCFELKDAGPLSCLTQLTSLSFRVDPTCHIHVVSQLSPLSGLQDVVVKGVPTEEGQAAREALRSSLPHLFG